MALSPTGAVVTGAIALLTRDVSEAGVIRGEPAREVGASAQPDVTSASINVAISPHHRSGAPPPTG